ncbi:MAG: hypothetical protein WBM35_14205, partial [Candidatus Electrothrix sp.]
MIEQVVGKDQPVVRPPELVKSFDVYPQGWINKAQTLYYSAVYLRLTECGIDLAGLTQQATDDFRVQVPTDNVVSFPERIGKQRQAGKWVRDRRSDQRRVVENDLHNCSSPDAAASCSRVDLSQRVSLGMYIHCRQRASSGAWSAPKTRRRILTAAGDVKMSAKL